MENFNRQLLNSVQKLQSMFSNLTQQEINEMLIDCSYNEEQVILRLISQASYLPFIRHRVQLYHDNVIYKQTPKPIHIETKPTSQPEPTNQSEPINQSEPVSQPEPSTPKPSKLEPSELKSNPLDEPSQLEPKKQEQEVKEISRQRHRVVTGRLALDDALKQIENCSSQGYEGWSDARLRAFKMIDKNPNSYYYRFNAPGEQQRKGKWSDQEHQLFLNRLAELGANSQWGIFSIAIPGRVGYQCSNYYRFLIESGQLQDPNYVLDANGKARYLFDKKADDGSIEKIFRKHSRHGNASENINTEPKKKKVTKRPAEEDEEEDENDPTFSLKKPYIPKKPKTNKYIPILPLTTEKRMTRQRYQELQNDHVVPE